MVRSDSINRHRDAAGCSLLLGRMSLIPNGTFWRLILWKWLRFSASLRCHMIIILDILTMNNSDYGNTMYLWFKGWVAWLYIHTFLSAVARFIGWSPWPVSPYVVLVNGIDNNTKIQLPFDPRNWSPFVCIRFLRITVSNKEDPKLRRILKANHQLKAALVINMKQGTRL